ncbi:MAG: potassium channel family protein, partial [Myxococcota bacterium]
LVCRELRERNLPFVVIDREEAKVSRELPDALVIEGDATQEDCIKRAGIERAKTLLILMPKDADNLFVTMSARLLNERLFIVTRAEDPATESKLKRAGADRVVAPYLLGGAHVVQSVLRPTLLEFIDLATQSQHLELQLEELHVGAGSPLAGVTCGEALPRDAELLLVALQRRGDKMRFRPREEERLREGDVLVVLGSRDALDIAQRRNAAHDKVKG